MRALALVLVATGAFADGLPPGLPVLGPVPSPAPFSIAQSTTPEGLTVWVLPRPSSPRATVLLTVRGGTAVDSRGKEGIGEILAYTVAEGTRTRSARKLAEDAQAAGAELLASVGPDAISVEASGLDVDRLIDVIADMARNATFPDEEVALVKANLAHELGERESTPEDVGGDVLARALFGDHPYRVTHASREVIAATTPEALRAEYRRRFRPERALLVVTGGVDAPAVAARVARAFSGWHGEGAPPAPVPRPVTPLGRRVVLVDRPGSVQSHLVVGRLAPMRADPSFFAALLGTTILGGMSSARVMTNLREQKGWAYSPSSALVAMERASVLELTADVRTDQTAAALAETLAELDRMGSRPPSLEELVRAKRYEIGSRLVERQQQEELARELAQQWTLDLPARVDWVARIEAVTLAELAPVAARLFRAPSQTVVVVGDARALAPALQKFGALTVVKDLPAYLR